MAESQGGTVNAVAIAFAVITLIVISMRLWARVFLVKRLGADDPLICVACLLSWAFSTVTVLAVKHGLGDHYVNVEPRGLVNMSMYSFYVWLSSIFYNACLGFIKISVLALYMRLGDRWLRRLAIVMIGVVGCQASANVIACIFQCNPVQAAYDLSIDPNTVQCIDIEAFYLANAAVNIATDLLTYTLPFRLIYNLQVPRRQKIGLAVILCLGLMACLSSIIRISYMPPMLRSTDPTWTITGAMYWSVIEINIGILAASIPSYKAIATRYMPRLLGSSGHGTSGPTWGKRSKSATGISGSNMLSSSGGGMGMGGRFQKMDQSRDTDHVDDGSSEVGLRPLDKSGKSGGGGGGRPMGLDTYIERVSSDGSAGEAPFNAPHGQIGVRTQIVTHYT